MGHRFLSVKNSRRSIWCAALCASCFSRPTSHARHRMTKKFCFATSPPIAGVRDNPLIGYSIVVGLMAPATVAKLCSPHKLWPTSCNAWEFRFPPIKFRVITLPQFLSPHHFLHSRARNGARRNRLLHWRCEKFRRWGSIVNPAARPDGQVYAKLKVH